MKLYKDYQGRNGLETRPLPCHRCGSSDAVTFYHHDNSTNCFKCKWGTTNKYETPEEYLMKEFGEEGHSVTVSNNVTPYTNTPKFDSTKTTTTFLPLVHRKITKETCERYGVRCDVDNTTGEVLRVRFPFYNSEGVQVNTQYKVYGDPQKGTKNMYWWESPVQEDLLLFGQSKFQSGWKIVTITEGQEDAMVANQILGASAPCVSIYNGAKSIKRNFQNIKVYDWLNSFDKIIVSFDDDTPGKEAVKEIIEMFPPDKIHVMKMKYKDANEYLKQGKAEEFKTDWRAAKPAILDGIKNLKEAREHALKPANVQKIDYPWEELNKLTRGIRMGEATTILSGTGQGKTTLMQELAWHLLQNTPYNLGFMFIENSERETVTNIVGTAMSYPLKFALENDEEYQKSVAEYDSKNGEGSFEKNREQAMRDTVDSGRIWSIADTDYNVNNMETVLSRCRYFARVLGCKVVFLDHISLLVSSGEHDGEERKALDSIATKLAMIVKELGIHLFIVSQANTPAGKALEEGGKTSINGVRGTRGVGHITHNMFGIERNGQAEDETERNTTMIRVLKCRWTGRTGISSYLLFNHETFRLTEVRSPKEAPTSEEIIRDTPIMDLTKFSGLETGKV